MKKKIHDLQSKRLQFPEGTAEREVSVWLVFMLIELKGTATSCHTILQLCNGRAEIAWFGAAQDFVQSKTATGGFQNFLRVRIFSFLKF